MDASWANAATVPLLAGIAAAKREPVDDVLEEAAARLAAAGLKVGGFVQTDRDERLECCRDTFLKSLSDGSRRLITQPLGAEATGCRLDPRRLAEASMAAVAELEGGLDAIVLNRFGKDEAEGRGFRDVIGKALEAKVAVIVAVRPDHAAALSEFGGEYATLLPARADAIVAWCLAALSRASAPAAAA